MHVHPYKLNEKQNKAFTLLLDLVKYCVVLIFLKACVFTSCVAHFVCRVSSEPSSEPAWLLSLPAAFLPSFPLSVRFAAALAFLLSSLLVVPPVAHLAVHRTSVAPLSLSLSLSRRVIR